MRYFVNVFALFLVLALLTTPSFAAVHSDTFYAALTGNSSYWNELDTSKSGGSGYTSSGPWYWYPAPDGTIQRDLWNNVNLVPGWHNQWYYDDPLCYTQWKEVTLTFDISRIDPLQNGGAIIVINWSTDLWSNEEAPPMSNIDEEGNLLIGRQEVMQLWIPADDPIGSYSFQGTFDLRDWGVDYNPVWISIDVIGYNAMLSSQDNPGSIIHECVPEPSAIVLLLISGGVFLALRLFRRA
jgi:hypothetical protein